MKPTIEMQGDDIIAKARLSGGLDADKDGIKSIEAAADLSLKIDGFECADELMKSSTIAQYMVEQLKKLGLIK